MELLRRFKNLFVPREEEKSRPNKVAKKGKRKILKKKAKKKIKPKKKVLKKKKKVIKKRGEVVKKKKSPKLLKKITKEKEIGIITHYFGKISVGIIKLKYTLKIGERIRLKGLHTNFTQTVKSIQINHKDVSMAGKDDEIGIKVPKLVHENDRVYKL